MTDEKKREPFFFEVPATAQRAKCDCGREDGLYWIMTQRGKRMQVDVSVEGGVKPVIDTSVRPANLIPGRGVSHFATCPKAAEHRKSRPGDGKAERRARAAGP